MRDGFWCFQCPECGFGSAELGRLAEDREFFCELCLEEGGGSVKLRRWLPEEEEVFHARLLPALAA